MLGGYLVHNNLGPLGVKNSLLRKVNNTRHSWKAWPIIPLPYFRRAFFTLLRRFIPIPISTNTLLFTINTLRCITLRLTASSCYLSTRLLRNATFSYTPSSHHHLQLDFYALEDIISITFNCKQPDFHRLVHA